MKKLFIYISLGVACFLYSCETNPDGQDDPVKIPDFEDVQPRYIAHAGGAYDGYFYTNSREAVLNAIGNGIKFIELDLALTSDNEVVCLHDWAAYNNVITGSPIDTALSLDEFVHTRLYGFFTPLTSYDIIDIWQQNPDIWLVTDKISDPQIIQKTFASISKRVVVECFTYDDYLVLRDKGYQVFMSTYPPQDSLEVLSCGATAYDSFVFYKAFDTSRGYFDKCAIFTCNNRSEADSLFASDPRISLIYIDNVE